MVMGFLHRQQNKDKSRREMAKEVANSFGRSMYTARKFIAWEKEWILHRRIPESRAGKHRACQSLLDDEGILCAIQDFTKTQGEGACNMISESRWLYTNIIDIVLTSYKLAQFLKSFLREHRPDISDACFSTGDIQDTIDQGRERAVTSRTIRRWLRFKLGFYWGDVKKGIFLDGHERDDVVEYRKDFLDIIHGLLPYMVEFHENGTMKPKEYPEDCRVGGPDRRPVILITHDESVFSANDGRHQAWMKKNGTISRPKGKGKGIMVSDFLLPWARLNLLSLPKERQDELTSSGIPLEAAVLFEYGKEDGYWDGQNLVEQITKQALPIATALYPGYQFLFLFDNATSHSVYADDALLVDGMNKGVGGQQPLLRDGWYHDGNGIVTQQMYDTKVDPATGNVKKIPKGIQKVLEERQLWPREKDPLLECPKPLCEECEPRQKCKDCVKGTKCGLCRQKKEHSGSCTTRRICDNCARRKESCTCVQKQYCAPCKKRRKEGCRECESLPAKCTSSSELTLSLPSLQTKPLADFILDCCARRLLSLQPDFMAQRCEIEEILEAEPHQHKVLYYPKFHCELNHIEYFWCHSKRLARENCNYTIDGLRSNVPTSLASIASKTILGNYNSCLKKMELYRQGVAYGSGEWKSLTSHQKAYVPGDDR
jgi:hypothetical protein